VGLTPGSTVLEIEAPTLETSMESIDAHSEQVGRPMGNNDVWIAATAAAASAWLLTTDKDFDHLHPALIRREWIAPAG
jgi:tRNA(fMet)-specific endonuclease VapC